MIKYLGVMKPKVQAIQQIVKEKIQENLKLAGEIAKLQLEAAKRIDERNARRHAHRGGSPEEIAFVDGTRRVPSGICGTRRVPPTIFWNPRHTACAADDRAEANGVGIYDRDYYRQERSGFSLGAPRSAVATLILINAAVFLADALFFDNTLSYMLFDAGRHSDASLAVVGVPDLRVCT